MCNRQRLPPWATNLFLPALEVGWRVTDLTLHYMMLQFYVTVSGTSSSNITLPLPDVTSFCTILHYMMLVARHPHLAIGDKNEMDWLGQDWSG